MDAEIFSLADKVIETLKMRKIVDLAMLINETGGNESDIRKIINLLEQQGMADVEYKLTKVIISWNDEADSSLQHSNPISRYHRISFDSNSKGAYQSSKSTSSAPLSSNRYNVKLQSELEPERDSSEIKSLRFGSKSSTEQNEGTSLLNVGLGRESKESGEREHIAQKAPVAQKVKEDNKSAKQTKEKTLDSTNLKVKSEKAMLKSDREGVGRVSKREEKIRKEVDEEVKAIEKNIRSKLKGKNAAADLANTDIVNSVRREHSTRTSNRERQKRGTVLRRYISIPVTVSTAAKLTQDTDEMQNSVQTFNLKIADKREVETKPMQTINDNDTAVFSNELSDKISAIRDKKVEIASLSRQKAGLLDESYAPLESKLDSELTIISDIISDKEKKLKNLRERLKFLPENFSSLEIESIELRNAEAEAKTRFDYVLDDLQKLASEIKIIKSSVNSELVDTKKSLRQQNLDLNELKELHAKYRAKETDVQGSIDAIRGRIEREQTQLGELDNMLAELQYSSSTIENRLNAIESKLDESSKVSVSASDLVGKLKELEGGISTVHTAYSDAKSRLLSDIDRYERDLLTLRESMEAGFARKYLSEIERLTENNDQELVAVAEKERRIDEALANKREELRNLILDARKLQDRMSLSLPKKQVRSIEEIKQELDLSKQSTPAQEEQDELDPTDRKGVIDNLNDILLRFKKQD